MVRVFKIINPFNPQDGLEKREYVGGETLGTIGEPYLETPWLCVAYVDGKRYFPVRSEWEDIILKDGDCVYFMPYVGDGLSFLLIAIISVAAVVVALSIKPPSVGSIPEADPVYSLKGQKNQVRLGLPIEDGYGRVRVWPSYATRPYNQNYGNNQFQFQLLCFGHGSWAIEDVLIEDTPIANFQEVEYEIYGPGEPVTLFPDNVETSVEVGRIEIYGSNEVEYAGPTGPFVANSAGTLTTHLEVDLTLPQGLYLSSGSTLLDGRVVALFEYRLIDSIGDPLVPDGIGETEYKQVITESRESSNLTGGITGINTGVWEIDSNVFTQEVHGFSHQDEVVTYSSSELDPGSPYYTDPRFATTRITEIYYIYDGGGWNILSQFDKTLATNNPQRFTLQADVPKGRYEVRATRTNDANTSHLAGDTLEWTGLRAFLPPVRDYGDLTMIAVKSRATNNLNDTASNRVNAYATRKLPTYDAGTLAAVNDIDNRAATRSPIWAMVNILRANYGGGLLDQFLDLSFLAAEATTAEAESIYFDWVFDQRTTVWEAVKLPCFTNKSIPMLNGSTISFVRDQAQTLPTFFINPENTKEGSFSIEKKLFDLRENDGLEVEYTDPATWKPEIISCLLGGQVGNNPKRIKLQGVTDRQRAYDLGMYLWYKETNEREQVTVTTGLEGYIPTYGDIGRFGSDIPRWGQNGYVESIDGSVVTLSEDLVFTDGEVHQIAIRGKHSQDLGPYTATAGDQPNKVVVSSTIPADQTFFDYQNEPPYFIFGVSNVVGKVCRVSNLTPGASGDVTIKAIVDDQGRHANFGTVPAISDVTAAPVIPDSPVVPSVVVSPVPNSVTLATVSWEPALGAANYILEQSIDGINWVSVDTVTRTNYSLPINTGVLFVRVAGVNVGIGPFISWTGLVGLLLDYNILTDGTNILTDGTNDLTTDL